MNGNCIHRDSEAEHQSGNVIFLLYPVRGQGGSRNHRHMSFYRLLIEYLIEYSVSRGHKSMRYIETVALAWADEGITTVTMAKEANSRYAKEYFTIFKSMGISGRNPVDTEISLMNTWLNDYGFTMDIIQEACSRTVLSTGQPSFQYADKILSGWKDKNVRTLADVRLLDAQHQRQKLEKNTQR